MPQQDDSVFDLPARFEHLGHDAGIRAELTALPGSAPLFSEFTADDIATLSPYLDLYRAGAGQSLIREGDPGDFMLLIVSGEVDIVKRGLHLEERHLTSVGPGMTVGEMSMIDGEPRFATCRATQVTTFAVLTREGMAKIVSEQPSLGAKILLKLAAMLSGRLRQMSAMVMSYMEGIH